MKKIFLIFLLPCITSTALAQHRDDTAFTAVPFLHGDSAVFPIMLVNAYPLIAGEVNGMKGKFMFDTGTRQALSLNHNYVQLPNRKEVRKGVAGSGQSFMVNVNDTIAMVKFSNGMAYNNLLNVESSNYGWLEDKITPDFIGFVGYDFFKGYILKLDYLKRKITFYKNTLQRQLSKDFLRGEKLLAVINFEIRNLPNHPLVKLKVGDTEILGSFDSGQYGLLQLDNSAEEKLTESALVRSVGLDGAGDELINVDNVEIDGVFTTSLKGIYPFTLEQTLPFRKAMQITEPNYMSIGYRFLDQYKTIWDYEEKKIYLLE